MALTAEREGQIALAYLKHRTKEEGFYLDQNFRRRVGNIAKQIGIPYDEALEFSIKIMSEIVAEVTDPSKVTENDRQGLDSEGHPFGHGH